MPRVNFIDGDSMTAGEVEIMHGWVKCVRHEHHDDNTWTEEQTHIPKHRIESIVSESDAPTINHRVEFTTD